MADVSKQIAWKIRDWQKAVPLSRSQIQEYVADGTIPSAKVGGVRFLVISPSEFIERHRKPTSETAA